MRIARAGLRAFVLPLVEPLATAHGAIRERAGFLVTLADESGRFGSGEASPLPAFGGEDRTACHEALRRTLAALADGSERDLDDAFRQIAAQTEGAPCARSALECALADLASQDEAISLSQWIHRRAGLPGDPAARIRTQALVGGRDPEAVRASAVRALDQGFDVFKLKLAVTPGMRDVSLDLERVAALRAAIGDMARIRLDANEAWDRREAEQALAGFAPFRIEFVEQPVPREDFESLAVLARTGPIPVAADEALLAPGGIEACLSGRGARILIAKPAVLGGITATIELAARARAAGIRLVFSNLIEGRVGREVSVALAAALVVGANPGVDHDEEAHGLGTAGLLARDFEPAPAPTNRAGNVEMPHAGAGLGVSPGACWAIEHEILGELECFDTDRPIAHAPDIAIAARTNAAVATGWLARFSPRHAARTALVFAEQSFTYAALVDAARAAGEALAGCGLVAGDLVAVLAQPSVAGVALIHGMFERGIVLLPLNARLSEPELAQALAGTRATALLVASSGDLEQAQRLAQGAGCGLFVFTPPRDPTALAPSLETRSRATPKTPSIETRAATLRSDHAALVLLTSGTSGRAKAAVLTRENLIASAEASARLLGGSAEDRWLLCLPLFHIAGLSILVRAALVGACVFLEPRFDPERVSRALDTSGISHVSFVATTLEQVLDARDARRAPASLRLVLLGGGPASEGLLVRAVAAGFPIAATYGLTEAASQVATRPPETPRASDSRGASDPAEDSEGVDHADGLVPLPGVALRIVDAANRPLAAGVEGEIQVRGPIVMRGYLDDPEATARVLRGGWLATGDIGRLDRAGRLRVFDRRSDLIVSGGENVYPAEIESLLAGHPDIVEVGVVGVADTRFGARPLAFVVWRAGATRDSRALAEWCRERLAGYKRPIDFVASEGLPRNASGKLLRRELALRTPKAAAEE